MLTPSQIVLVKESFNKLSPKAELAAAMFYNKLFQLAPNLRPLFKGDIKEQGQKLMQTLSVAVKGLDKIEGLVPAIEDLGRRHKGYGVKDEDYDIVGIALLWMIEECLGKEFNPELKDAWAATYSLMADRMIHAR